LKIGDDNLPQGNTAIVAGHLTVSIYLKAGGLKQGGGFIR
jgi:hypothetical protein